MGKGRARKKGTMRRAYLKKMPSAYDPNSQYALRSRGGKAINLAALARDVKTGELFHIEYAQTVTHGKRGLTIARAVGPTVVAKDFDSLPSMVPRSEVATKILDNRAVEASQIWHNWRRQGMTKPNSITLVDIPGLRKLELWFAGQEWMFVKINYKNRTEARSRVYPSKPEAMLCYQEKNNRKITWIEVLPLPPHLPVPSS